MTVKVEDNLPICINEYHQRKKGKKEKKFVEVSGRHGIRRFQWSPQRLVREEDQGVAVAYLLESS